MVILELAEIIDVLVDDDPKTVRLVMRSHIRGLESLRHDDGYKRRPNE